MVQTGAANREAESARHERRRSAAENCGTNAGGGKAEVRDGKNRLQRNDGRDQAAGGSAGIQVARKGGSRVTEGFRLFRREQKREDSAENKEQRVRGEGRKAK